MLDPKQIDTLIRTHPQAWDVWLYGYQAGVAAGIAQGLGTREQQSEEAARRFYALTADEEDHKRLAKLAAAGLEVDQVRREAAKKVAALQAAWERERKAA